MPKDKITFPELDAMSMRADESHDTFDSMAKEAFEQWQSELPDEFKMQYVPLFGEGFYSGLRHAANQIALASLDPHPSGIDEFFDRERCHRVSHGYEAIGRAGVTRIWNAATLDAARKLESLAAMKGDE